MKNDNKGFSLIELIVVIAIMAILVGAIAPQVTKYIQRARESADIQAVGALYTAMSVSLIDPNVANPGDKASTAWSGIDATQTGLQSYNAAVIETLGMTADAFNASLKSNKYKGKVPTAVIGGNGTSVTITVTGTGATLTVNAQGASETPTAGVNNN